MTLLALSKTVIISLPLIRVFLPPRERKKRRHSRRVSTAFEPLDSRGLSRLCGAFLTPGHMTPCCSCMHLLYPSFNVSSSLSSKDRLREDQTQHQEHPLEPLASHLPSWTPHVPRIATARLPVRNIATKVRYKSGQRFQMSQLLPARVNRPPPLHQKLLPHRHPSLPDGQHLTQGRSCPEPVPHTHGKPAGRPPKEPPSRLSAWPLLVECNAHSASMMRLAC